ncbi:SpoIIE family protein phosphatase [Cellulomonas endophytica]|uniref:SpoIIE family protein phosphatase n=1 Tax=Cellulomonas endophytica TaxID=2494735 RepID=UPI0010102C7C|nr:SpoIIE family protein phosphatase [Cellulomonas endophytica]
MGTEGTGEHPAAAPRADVDLVLGRLAIEAAGIGTYEWDLATGELRWSDRMLELAGFDRSRWGGRIEDFDAIVHPDDRAGVHAAIGAAMPTGGDFAIEYRITTPAGRTRWFAARGRVLLDLDGTPVRVVGSAFDTTDVSDAALRVARLLEAMPTAFIALDHDWRFTFVNGEAERLLGRGREELLGGDVWSLFPAAPGTDFERHYRHALATGEPVAFDAYYPAPLDRWYEVRAWPGPEGLSVYFLDVSARHRAQEAAERARRRLELLAEVSGRLGETLDAERAVGLLARTIVPALADWCVVTLVDEHGPAGRRVRDIASWHVDPAYRPLVERYTASRLTALDDASFLRAALEGGLPVRVPEPAHERIATVLRSGEARELLAVLAPRSAAVLPMRARGRTVGALSLFTGPAREGFDEEDLRTATEVAARAGLALDNARLYGEQVHVAEALQRAMLSDPPEPDHVEIAVRYEPAAEAARVGGDWYDAFLQGDGRTVLVVGDVVGHDMEAAAQMGQLRALLRGVAVATGAGPAELLRRVDGTLRTLGSPTIATAVVARVEQTPDERARGVSRVVWSSAGHPAPVVAHPDGTVDAVAPGATDALLGVVPDSPREEHTLLLERGSTVLLYTDGLVERRGEPLAEGTRRLRDVLAEPAARDQPLKALLDTLVARLLPARPTDDVALVGVRLHRQDEPRPAQAGPNQVPSDVPPDAPDRPGATGPTGPTTRIPPTDDSREQR